MLTVYDAAEGVLVPRSDPQGINDGSVWIDLLNPTKEEDRTVERALGIAVPTREEMAEIEASSRLYQEGGAHYMTAVVPFQPGAVRRPPPETVRFRYCGTRTTWTRPAAVYARCRPGAARESVLPAIPSIWMSSKFPAPFKAVTSPYAAVSAVSIEAPCIWMTSARSPAANPAALATVTVVALGMLVTAA